MQIDPLRPRRYTHCVVDGFFRSFNHASQYREDSGVAGPLTRRNGDDNTNTAYPLTTVSVFGNYIQKPAVIVVIQTRQIIIKICEVKSQADLDVLTDMSVQGE